ncbi:MAG: endolytic transglycosylase MltG [Gallionella sp.]|nr:endolytic transglycosylase MltG [Gallionella sp.]MDP1939977.1 endolytic transglycosylase MltG [Gallionella sp.]
MMRKLKVLLLLLMLACVGLAYYAYSPLAPAKLPLEFTLNQGSSLSAVARQFEREGLLESPRLFVAFARLLGRAGQIKAGVYQLDQPVSRMELLTMITRGNVSKSQITLIEGWNFRQLRNMLNASPNLRHDTLNLSDSEILQRIGAPESHPEGLFFPETYHIAAGGSDIELLKVAYRLMQQRLNEAWQARSPDLPLETPYQALILASIVEKETGAASDRPMIAGVFVNRLRIRMMLQTDPTVIYGMGEKFDGNLRRRDLTSDTPYNTYTRGGLPPTPIAMPGRDALHAALHPASTNALYFVARGDGSSKFSSNLNAHNQAVNRYQK